MGRRFRYRNSARFYDLMLVARAQQRKKYWERIPPMLFDIASSFVFLRE
jgi:hypothetical protein